MTRLDIRAHVGWLLAALGIAAVSITTCLLRAVIWCSTALLVRWLRTDDGCGYFRDIFRSEAIRQLDVAGIDPKKPYALLGVECPLLKDMILGGGPRASNESS